MSSNIGKATSVGREITIGGRVARVRPLTMEAVSRLQDFANRMKAPDYIGKARDACSILDAEAASPRLQEAVDKTMAWPPDILYDGIGELQTDEGFRVELIRWALRDFDAVLGSAEANDEAKRAKAREIMATMEFTEYVEVVKAAFASGGKRPPNEVAATDLDSSPSTT